MSNEKTSAPVDFPPRLVFLLQAGFPSGRKASLMPAIVAEINQLDNRSKHGGIEQHVGPSPMACNTGSLFLDTVDTKGWIQVGTECYTSNTDSPLYLLLFLGFDDGDYTILTNMSWRMKFRSVVNAQEAFFTVCSVPTHGLLCPLSSDEPPSSTATICALGGAHFQSDTPPSPATPSAPQYKDRKRFQHQSGGTDGILADIVLNVGSSFSAKFTASNPGDCFVGWGVPPKTNIEQHLQELFSENRVSAPE